MADILPTGGLVLHIWPGQWDLPSFDPPCLAAVLYLQLAIPGKFRIVENSNPDSSPSGQLPYLVHDQHVVTSFQSIVKYVSDLRSVDHAQYPDANLDILLTPSQKSQRTAWTAHAESHLGDLVYHSLYAMDDNWVNMTGPALASMFPVPQKYYVPRRIRDAHFPKLEAAGLWSAPIEEKPTEKPFQKDKPVVKKESLKKNSTIAQTFERQKVLERGRAEFDIYHSLLEGKSAVFHAQPSSLDTLIAAHILLILKPPYSDTLLKTLLIDSYPSLASYARQIESSAFGSGQPDIKISTAPFSLRALLPSWPERSQTRKVRSPEDQHFDHMRWGFIGLVVGSFAAYLAIVAPQYKIVFAQVEQVTKEDDSEVGNTET